MATAANSSGARPAEPGSSPQTKQSRTDKDKGKAGGKVDGVKADGGKAGDGSEKAIVSFAMREFQVQSEDRLVEKMAEMMAKQTNELKLAFGKDVESIKVNIGELKQQVESTRSELSAANEIIRSLKMRMDNYEKCGGGKQGAGTASNRNGNSWSPGTADTGGDLMAKVIGFHPSTFKPDLEKSLQNILDQTKVVVKPEDRFCPGRRSDYGLIKFTDPAAYREFMSKTRGQVYKFHHNKMDMEVKVVPKRSGQHMEESKELRALLRTVGELSGIPRDAPDRQILDVQYRKRHVYFGNSIVGEFTETEDGQHERFTDHYDRIAKEGKDMNMEITEERTKSLYDKTLASMTFRR